MTFGKLYVFFNKNIHFFHLDMINLILKIVQIIYHSYRMVMLQDCIFFFHLYLIKIILFYFSFFKLREKVFIHRPLE